MSDTLENSNIVILKVQVQPKQKAEFIDWQTKFNRIIAGFTGFISLEILSPRDLLKQEWIITERFYDAANISVWRNSQEYKELMDELQKILGDKQLIQETASAASNLRGGVTEVIVTEVNPEKENAYREWIAKVHQIEAKFPGFLGTYVQSPSKGFGKNWITLLQFDTPENLDRWLSSSERQEILKESTQLINALESHRVISSYGGWFSSIAKEGEIPPAWKQSMLVLLVLYPIVIMQMRYLSPLLTGLNHALATFLSNAISVALIAWPMMPIAIWLLGWWLLPKNSFTTIIGIFVVLGLYIIEIALLWHSLNSQFKCYGVLGAGGCFSK